MRRLGLLVLSVMVLCSRLALADEPPSLVPPVARGSLDVAYPDGATGDAVVVLEVLVARDGSVAEVTVVEGGEPFAEEARRVAATWQFEPARRGDDAVAARIRARVEFHADSAETEAPPVSVARPAEAESAAPAPPAKPLPVAPSEEVTVSGRRPEVGRTTLSAAEVRSMPGAFGDAFRSVEALPGVTGALSGVPYFFVRAAPPNNNGYFLDGIRVPLLFHVGLGPGVLHPALLERLDFYPGPAPVSFGNVAGAVIAGNTRAPAERAHGEVSLRLVDAGALLEAPFAGGRASALAAGRYGYPGPIVGAISDTELGYWDYQSRVEARVGERDTLRLFAFGSHDYLGQRDLSGTAEEVLVSDFHRIDLRHQHRFGDGRAELGATLGYDSQGANPTYLKNRSAALRLDVTQRATAALAVRAGLDARIDAYAIDHDTPLDPEQAVPPSSAEPARTNITGGVYAELVWTPLRRIQVVPGGRVGLFDSAPAAASGDAAPRRTTVVAVDPRLALRVEPAERVALLSNVGISHQYPVLRVGAVPALLVAGAGFPAGSDQLQRVLSASQGVELHLPAGFVLTTTGFLTRSWGLTDLTASCLQIEPPTAAPGEGPRPSDPYYCPSNAAVAGHAVGLEVLLRRSFSQRVSGLLSYTLSRSVRESHFLTLEGGEAVATVPSDFDRTHVLNAILSVDLGRRWRAGSRFVFYSGAPYSELSGNVPVPPYNSSRDPAFFRFDVRLEKRWELGRERWLSFVFEALNVTLSKDANTLGMDCRGLQTPDQYTTECERGEVGPITVPSVGLEAGF